MARAQIALALLGCACSHTRDKPSDREVPAPQHSAFIFGMHTQAWDQDVQRTIRESASIGATHVTLGFMWHDIEPRPGLFTWEKYDRIVDCAAKAEIEVIPQLLYSVEGSWRPPDPEDYARYAAAVARRYCDAPGFSRIFQVWNEPNAIFWQGTAAQYAVLLDTAYGAIKEACPKSIVVGFNLASAPNVSDWLEAAMASSPRFDWFGWHSYGPPPFQMDPNYRWASEAGTGYVRALLDGLGLADKPMFDTERGASLREGIELSGAILAQAYVALYAAAPRSDVRGFTWYLYHDNAFGDGDHGIVGLGNSGWYPRPAWCTFKTVTGLLSAYTYDRQLSGRVGTSDVQAHLMRNESSGALLALFAPILWDDALGCRYVVRESQTVEIRAPVASGFTKVDWVGRETPMSPRPDGVVEVDVTWRPTYVRFSLPQGSPATPQVDLLAVAAETVTAIPMDREIAAFVSLARSGEATLTDACSALREWHRGLSCCLGEDVVNRVMTPAQVDDISIAGCIDPPSQEELWAVLQRAFAALDAIPGQASCPVSEMIDEQERDVLLGILPRSGTPPSCGDY